MKKISIVLSIVISILFISCSKSDNPTTPSDTTNTTFTIPAVEDVVMYEMNPRILGSNSTLTGIAQKLDHIKSLQTNVLWLMPIYPIGKLKTANSPYCVMNYKQVNPALGTLEDLKTLVNEAHKRGIAVVLDWVANHTSWDNPWISNKAWYTQDGNGNIISPAGTNWTDVADLNFSNAEMRLEMINSMKFWVEQANVDGFRCDAADMIPYDFWKQAIDSLRAMPNRNLLMLAEGSRADHFSAGFQMNYAWDFYGVLKNVFVNNLNAIGLINASANENATLTSGKRKLRFTTNHDESAWDKTPMQLFNGKQGALAASVVTYFISGTPLIYSTQEVGVTNQVSFFYQSTTDWTLNPDMLASYKKMMTFFATSTPLRRGNIQSYTTSNVVCFKRIYRDEEVTIIVNVRNSNQTFTVPAALTNSTLTDVMAESSITLGPSLNLTPYQFMILKK